MNKNQLKAILKINGCDECQSDEEIRAILLGARYSPEEIDNALVVLHAQDVPQPIRSDGLHKVFYSDGRLRPQEIAGLLGIEVDVNFGKRAPQPSESRSLTSVEVGLVVGLAVLFAVVGAGLYMYIHDIGLFHSLAVAGE
jgi:hypothetical protein